MSENGVSPAAPRQGLRAGSPDTGPDPATSSGPDAGPGAEPDPGPDAAAATSSVAPDLPPPGVPRVRLIAIGDEILSGRREDQHFAKLIQLLQARGMRLNAAEFISDDEDEITACLRRSF